MRPFGFDGGENAPSATGEPYDASGCERRPDQGLPLAEIFFPELAEWRQVLVRLSVPWQTAVEAAISVRTGVGDFQSALLASGVVSRVDMLRAIAADLDLGVVEAIDPARIIVSDEHASVLLRGRNGQIPVKLLEKDGGIAFLITFERLRLGDMRRRIADHPALARHLKIVDPQVLRAAVLARSQPVLEREAVLGLFERHPSFSARIVANAWQGTMAGVAITALPVGLLLAWDEVLATLHVLATIFFLACVVLRFAAVASVRPLQPPQPLPPLPEGEMPVYSVLVALYREAAIVPDLLAALDRLVWPRDRLDIKLVCEADDEATLDAIRTSGLPSHIEIIEVPAEGPRTKPKALAYAMQMVGGEFVALYDAEDQPHPLQLVEAWHRFRNRGSDLAAVQAPLEISNRRDTMMARMFAFEYAGLFRGLLPWLSQRRLMLPLGGTSNHFRRAALAEVGGWDPFNVTEDADLGMRLTRFGYRAEVISRPTYEAAPERFEIWLPQRTRWFKGWAQTWLVHMRDPARLGADLGVKSFLVAQVLFAGMLASALLHPVLLATFGVLVVQLAMGYHLGTYRSMLFAMDIVNITCGYLSFLTLGWQTLTAPEKRGFWKIVLFTPVYWALLSAAGWRALWYLWRNPHHWEKTPHEPVSRPAAGASGRPTRRGGRTLRQ
jgi:cellulose synthase/poly-beta-1,6-N-acetylglucosamine synthase-like glycosyltransferase